MDYALDTLGDRNFEHLVQALFSKFAGRPASVFGDGADGGREATWDGTLPSDSRVGPGWEGFGVLQAKFKQKDTHVPAQNADWLISQIQSELREWDSPLSARRRKPDYLLIATNVTLSPGNGGGIERVNFAIENQLKKLDLNIRGWTLWHRDTIRTLLDDAHEIRKRYAAWITPGDLIAAILDRFGEEATALRLSIQAYTARKLRDGSNLNLTQAGSVADQGLRIDQVFIDLPTTSGDVGKAIVASADRTRTQGGRQSHLVLVGGPGQGKSTVTQFMSQLYRASFLRGSPVTDDPELSETTRLICDRAAAQAIPLPSARRWPMRVLLTDFADQLAKSSDLTLLQYIAAEVASVSGHVVAAAQMHTWLRDCPWLLLLDGLDEVPATSNRAETVRAVNDFLLDAANAEADVLVLATTRPQGYNDEFSGSRFNRVDLAPLPSGTALEYMLQLCALRVGVGSDRYKQIARQLAAAAEEPETSRLMSTPLQATILSLLVERQGRAPKDRWRLFSQYYRVIFQREQEKGGELGELLSQYESDINAVHFAAGFTLQARSEEAGETESVLTLDELDALLVARLTEQGHDPASARDLALKIQTVTTERLVFLALLRSGIVGFEVRSLQEFMAGEQILTRPANEMITSLRAISVSAHWSNVLLFAVGKIFAEREEYRSEVVTLCEILNSENRTFEVGLPGSALALRILEEGVAGTAPRYAKLLGSIASRICYEGPDPDMARLASVAMAGYVELGALATKPEVDLVAGVHLLAHANDAGAEVSEHLETLIERASSAPSDRVHLVQIASTFESSTMLEACDVLARRMPPSNAIAASAVSRRQDDRVDPASDLGTVFHVLALSLGSEDDDDRVELEHLLRSDHPLSSITVPSGSGARGMESLAAVQSDHIEWKRLRTVAAFLHRPSPASFSAAAKAIQDARDPLPSRIARTGPWPLALRATVLHQLEWSGEVDLAEAAIASGWVELERSGVWSDTEDSWREMSPDDLMEWAWATAESWTGVDSLKTLDNNEFTVITPRMRLQHGRSDTAPGVRGWQIRQLRRLRDAPESPAKAALASLLLFDAGAMGSQLSLDESTIELEPLIGGDVAHAGLAAANRGWADVTWVNLLDDAEDLRDPSISSALIELGAAARLQRTQLENSIADGLESLFYQDPDAHWPVGRILLLAGHDLPAGAELRAASVRTVYSSFHAASRLLHARERLTPGELEVVGGLLRADAAMERQDSIDQWSILDNPALLDGSTCATDYAFVNFAEFIAQNRQHDRFWSVEAIRILRTALEALPAEHRRVEGIHEVLIQSIDTTN